MIFQMKIFNQNYSGQVLQLRKNEFLKFFRRTKKKTPFQKLSIRKTIRNETYALISGKSRKKIGIFGAPNYDLIEGYKTDESDVCSIFKQYSIRLSKLYIKDVFIESPEVFMNEMLGKI